MKKATSGVLKNFKHIRARDCMQRCAESQLFHAAELCIQVSEAGIYQMGGSISFLKLFSRGSFFVQQQVSKAVRAD